MEPGAASPDVLLERGSEIAAIDAAVASACSGTGSVLFIEGAAGIGKTRLLARACERAAAAGMTVLVARAAEYEDGYAWGVVRQLFEAELRAGSHQATDAAALAARVVTGTGTGDLDSYAVLHGLYWLTADIAQQAPLLLAVDDLHWADPPSQRYAAYLARRLDGLPVLLAVSVREPRAGTAKDKALIAGLAAEPGASTVRPAPLSTDGCARLTAAALSQPPSPAFASACQELTGGNPLLLRGLLATLSAEGAAGTDSDVPHLRRLTPESVSRHVLLRLGRLPDYVLAAARATAVLGNAATIARVGRLAGLADGDCAEGVAALMAEQFIEGERALRFVHPVVRSAVYEDLAPPVRQRWHKNAAVLLRDAGAPAPEVTVHLLAATAEGDQWVTGQLRKAAQDARAQGAPEVAAQCLERALAEPPPAGARAELLYELGTALTFHAPAVAAERLAEARALAGGWPLRGEIAVALGEALALCGRFAAAVALVQEAIGETPARETPAGADQIVASLQAVLLNIARWDLSTRAVTRPLVEELLAKAEAGVELDPQLHANLAIELTVAGTERQRALRHARVAVSQASRLTSLTSTALPEAVLVLSLADARDEAWRGIHEWQEIARRRGRPAASAMAASIAAHIAARDGDIRQSLAFGEQALAAEDTWVAILAAAFLVPALIDAGDSERARAMLADRGLLTGPLLPVFPFNMAKYARGCLHAACGDHEAAVTDLLALGQEAAQWGIVNPAAIAWRSAAALSLSALGDRDTARQLAAEELDLARRWGAARETGVALRATGLVAGGAEGIAALTEAVTVLRGSPARLELARALGDLGAGHRRGGSRGGARDLLRESLDLAYALGGQAVAAHAREELVAAGGRPRRDASHGRDALTPSELRVAELAAAGRTNRQIAQALFVTQRTVENHLTSTYAKLGITARPELAAALDKAQPGPPTTGPEPPAGAPTTRPPAPNQARRTAPTSR
jgi:DNA-binding CsgD family transcriptional regulator/tetratricopeptide (TPR) repeat protein